MAIQKLSTAAGAGSTIPVAGRYAAVSGGTVTTYSSGGLTYQVQTFTASGTLTVSNSGMVDILVVGGGAAGGVGGGGGAGGVLSVTGSAYLPSGSLTVTVGAGGAGSSGLNGNSSRLGDFYGIGGGVGGGVGTGIGQFGFNGGSGGGGMGNTNAGGFGISGQGNTGGSGASGGAGGGGGEACTPCDPVWGLRF